MLSLPDLAILSDALSANQVVTWEPYPPPGLCGGCSVSETRLGPPPDSLPISSTSGAEGRIPPPFLFLFGVPTYDSGKGNAGHHVLNCLLGAMETGITEFSLQAIQCCPHGTHKDTEAWR